MKRFFGCALVLLCAVLSAQENGNSLIKNAQMEILVNDVIAANREINALVTEYSLTVEKGDVNNSRKTGEYTLFVRFDRLDETVAKIERLGLIQLKKIESVNNASLIQATDFELAYLASQKESYHSELSVLDKKSDSYKDFFNKERDIDRQIYEKTKAKTELAKKISSSRIQLKIFEKTVQDLDSKDDFFSLINMPGVESKYFRLENQGQDVMSDQYFGGSLRYMFTKGRSYFLIGVMKPLNNNDAENSVDDIVSYSFGKDFYPRYLGQGKNTFFNPFSGFEIGGMILTSDGDIDNMVTLEPHIGLELFKNKYFIIDTRISYLFPLDQEKIKTHRGFTHNFSVNFVF